MVCRGGRGKSNLVGMLGTIPLLAFTARTPNREKQLPGPKLGAFPAPQEAVGTGNGGIGMFWKEGIVLMLFLILPTN